MSSKAELRKHGIVSKTDELLFTRNVKFDKDVIVDKSMVIEPDTDSRLNGNVVVTGDIIRGAWGNRRYIYLTLDLSAAGPHLLDFVVPSACFIRSIRSVVDADPGGNVDISLASYDPYMISSDFLSIANGTPAGGTDLWTIDLTDADNLAVATCGAGALRVLAPSALAANPCVAFFVIELYDLTT